MKTLELLFASAFAATMTFVAEAENPQVVMSETALANFKAQVERIYALGDAQTAAERKMDSSLALTVQVSKNPEISKSLSSALAKEVQPGELVPISCIISCKLSDRVLSLIRSRGAVEGVSENFGVVRATIFGSDGLAAIAADSDVTAVRRVLPNQHNKSTTSQGVAGHKAASARSSYGVTGKGVRVGVISDGVNDLAKLQKSGDLPSDASAVKGFEGNGNEGAAMMEIIYDMAPGASLRFAYCGMSCEEYAEAILALRKAGCKVIVDDICRPEDPAFDEGVISRTINDFIAAGGVYVTCACNSGSLDGRSATTYGTVSSTSCTWQGDFVKSTHTYTVNGTTYQMQAFNPNQPNYDWVNTIQEPNLGSSSGYTTVSLQWSDRWGASSNDYDLFIVSPTGDVLAYSMERQTGSGYPFEYLAISNELCIYGNGVTPCIVIAKKSSAAPRFMRVEVYRGRIGIQTDGSIYGHHASENVITCAAAAAPKSGAFTSSFELETFSSDGPCYRFYDTSGKPVTAGNLLKAGAKKILKPNVTAADGVSCSATGFDSFYGTSSAAPHAAAIAALMLEANPSLTASQIRSIMESSAISKTSARTWNRNYGYGVLDAVACVKNAKAYKAVYTVAFAGNGATSGSMSAQTYERGKIYTLPKCAFKKTGKAFKGWRGSNGRRYDDGVLVFNAADEGKTLTLTAIWE